jgi:hypothetical protein
MKSQVTTLVHPSCSRRGQDMNRGRRDEDSGFQRRVIPCIHCIGANEKFKKYKAADKEQKNWILVELNSLALNKTKEYPPSFSLLAKLFS